MHPCRKLVLKSADERILEFLSTREKAALEDLHELVSEWNLIQLKKRLTQLKKHRYIQCDRAYTCRLRNQKP